MLKTIAICTVYAAMLTLGLKSAFAETAEWTGQYKTHYDADSGSTWYSCQYRYGVQEKTFWVDVAEDSCPSTIEVQ